MLQSLRSLFFPESCCSCDSELLAAEEMICTHCRHTLPITDFHRYNDPSIKKVEAKGFLPNESSDMTKFSFVGEFHGGAENVKIVHNSVTNIFNSLASEQEPNEADFRALAKVIGAIFTAMEDVE